MSVARRFRNVWPSKQSTAVDLGTGVVVIC